MSCWEVTEEPTLSPPPLSRVHFALLLVQAGMHSVSVPCFQNCVYFSILSLCSGTVPVVPEQRTNTVPGGSVCVVVPARASVTAEPTSPLAEPTELWQLWDSADLSLGGFLPGLVRSGARWQILVEKTRWIRTNWKRWWDEEAQQQGVNIQVAAGTMPASGVSAWGTRIQQLLWRPEGQSTSVLLCSWLAVWPQGNHLGFLGLSLLAFNHLDCELLGAENVTGCIYSGHRLTGASLNVINNGDFTRIFFYMSWREMKCYLDLNWVRVRRDYPVVFPSISLACGKEFMGKWASTKAIAFREATEAENLMHFSILHWVEWNMQKCCDLKIWWRAKVCCCCFAAYLYFREQHISLSLQNFQKVRKSLITAAWAVWSPWFRKVSIISSQPFARIGTFYRLSLFR